MALPLTTITVDATYLNYLRSLESHVNFIVNQNMELQYTLENEIKEREELQYTLEKMKKEKEELQRTLENERIDMDKLRQERNEAMIWTPRPWELNKCNHLPISVVKTARNLFGIPWFILVKVELNTDYKTTMCTDKKCKRTIKCTKAHSEKELRFFKRYFSN